MTNDDSPHVPNAITVRICGEDFEYERRREGISARWAIATMAVLWAIDAAFGTFASVAVAAGLGAAAILALALRR